LGAGDGIFAACTGKIFGAMLPKSGKRAKCCGVVATLQEVSQTLALRASVRTIFCIVDVDLQLRCKKLRETGVRKVQDKARTSYEIDELLNKTQISGPYRAYKNSLQRSKIRLLIYHVL